MRATHEVLNLLRKLLEGTLPPDEPLFVLRAQDCTAAEHVRAWCAEAEELGAPAEKIEEARQLAALMDSWPATQIPGRPDTLSVKRE